MDYHEFVCAGAPTLFLVTAAPEPDRIPGAAQQCCLKWTYVRSIRLGDGSLTPDLETAIKVGVASEGYHIHIRRPTTK